MEKKFWCPKRAVNVTERFSFAPRTRVVREQASEASEASEAGWRRCTEEWPGRRRAIVKGQLSSFVGVGIATLSDLR